MLKIGTVEEIKSSNLKKKIPKEVFQEVLKIITMLDDVYGSDRDVDKNDGGFVVIAENVQDIEAISHQYVALNSGLHQAVDVVKCKDGLYINAFFICNNEFGINVFMSTSIAPNELTKNLP